MNRGRRGLKDLSRVTRKALVLSLFVGTVFRELNYTFKRVISLKIFNLRGKRAVQGRQWGPRVRENGGYENGKVVQDDSLTTLGPLGILWDTLGHPGTS